jgi:hypothetical protein
MSIQEHIEIAYKNLERLLDWVNRFDTKLPIILGVDTAMLGILATFAPPLYLWNQLMTYLTIVSVALLTTSLFFVYLGSYPQTKAPSKSLLYFGSMARNTFTEYQQTFLNQSAEDYLNDLLEQGHRNSEILDRKFKMLKWAYRMLFIGVLPWATTVYLFKSFSYCK